MTYNLCRINMFLHDVDFSNFDIALRDTHAAPRIAAQDITRVATTSRIRPRDIDTRGGDEREYVLAV